MKNDFKVLLIITVVVVTVMNVLDIYFNIYEDIRETVTERRNCNSHIMTKELLTELGDPFPVVTMLIFFKETSYCRSEYKTKGYSPSLCSFQWEKDFGFNPNNPLSMKHPKRRRTTSLGPLGDFIPSIPDSLKQRYRILPDLESAVYASIKDAIIDYRYWQEIAFADYGFPSSDEDYIYLLKRAGYNPYRNYYEGSSGLLNLYEMFLNGEFQNKYQVYYEAYLKTERKRIKC